MGLVKFSNIYECKILDRINPPKHLFRNFRRNVLYRQPMS